MFGLQVYLIVYIRNGNRLFIMWNTVQKSTDGTLVRFSELVAEPVRELVAAI